MPDKEAFARFAGLFIELDGGLKGERQDVTEGCVEALFDRVMNPTALETEDPTLEDVDAAVRIIIALVEKTATRVRKIIAEGHSSSTDPCPLRDDGGY